MLQDKGCMPFKPTLQHASTLLLFGIVGCSSDRATTSGTDNGDASTAGTIGTTHSVTTGTQTATAAGTGTASVATATTDVSAATSTTSTSASASSSGTATSGSATSGTGGDETTAGVGGATGGTDSASSSTGATTGPSPESIVIQDNFDSAIAGMPPDTELWEGYPQGQES